MRLNGFIGLAPGVCACVLLLLLHCVYTQHNVMYSLTTVFLLFHVSDILYIDYFVQKCIWSMCIHRVHFMPQYRKWRKCLKPLTCFVFIQFCDAACLTRARLRPSSSLWWKLKDKPNQLELIPPPRTAPVNETDRRLVKSLPLEAKSELVSQLADFGVNQNVVSALACHLKGEAASRKWAWVHFTVGTPKAEEHDIQVGYFQTKFPHVKWFCVCQDPTVAAVKMLSTALLTLWITFSDVHHRSIKFIKKILY